MQLFTYSHILFLLMKCPIRSLFLVWTPQVYGATYQWLISGIREQVNQVTAFIDGSHIYGSDWNLAWELRHQTGGLLKIDEQHLLPVQDRLTDSVYSECVKGSDQEQCFKAGEMISGFVLTVSLVSLSSSMIKNTSHLYTTPLPSYYLYPSSLSQYLTTTLTSTLPWPPVTPPSPQLYTLVSYHSTSPNITLYPHSSISPTCHWCNDCKYVTLSRWWQS